MSTAALPLTPAPVLVPADHVHDAISRAERAERDLLSVRLRATSLEGALFRLRDLDDTVTYQVVDRVLHACWSSGRIERLEDCAITRPGESGYEKRWIPCAPVPQSAAAIVEEALAPATFAGMAVVDGEDDDDDFVAQLERSL